jgi:hypothetical protein
MDASRKMSACKKIQMNFFWGLFEYLKTEFSSAHVTPLSASGGQTTKRLLRNSGRFARVAVEQGERDVRADGCAADWRAVSGRIRSGNVAKFD